MQQNLSFIHSGRYKLTLSIAYGVFLYLFLMLFLPFGVSNYDPDHEYTFKFLLEISIFMPATIVASLINEFVLKGLVPRKESYAFIIVWTLWSMIYLGLIIFTIYNYLGNWHDWKLSSVPGFVFNTATVLVFPAVAVFFYFRYKNLQEHYDAILTNTLSGIDAKQMILFTGQDSKDKLSVSVENFLYARAQDNYLELYYLKNKEVAKFLIRSSLANIESSLEYEFLVRCHRSFLINLYNVHSVKGNRKNLQISMLYSEGTIPVSQTYVDVTLRALRQFKQFQ